MWLMYAFGSAFFAGVTSILAKCGIKQTSSNTATAIRTVVVLVFSWLMVFIVGSQGEITDISARTWLFLVLSGLATGASWLCYFRALQTGDINKVVPIDKSSTVLTVLLAFVILGESITLLKVLALVLIAAGTYLMIQKRCTQEQREQGKGRIRGRLWLVYAALSAVFASLTAILGKLGIEGVEANLGTAIRTAVVLVMAWVVVFVTGERRSVLHVPKNELLFVCLSGLATGASWLCYYKALKNGAACVVVPVDKLSILVTIAFSYIVFREKLTKRSAAGLVLIVAGTLAMIF